MRPHNYLIRTKKDKALPQEKMNNLLEVLFKWACRKQFWKVNRKDPRTKKWNRPLNRLISSPLAHAICFSLTASFTSTISPVVAREAVLQLVELFRHRHICEAVAGYPMDEIWREVDPGALSWSPFKWPSHIQYLRSIKGLVHATCGYFKEELWVLGRNHAHRIQLWDLFR